MRPLIVLTVGLVFTGLVIGVPLSEGGGALTRGTPWGWWIYACPLLALAVCMGTRRSWVGIWLFPISHLPALALEPALTAAHVYGGSWGMVRLAILAFVGWAWVVAFSRRRPSFATEGANEAVPLSTRLWPVVVFVVGASVFTAFVQGALRFGADDPVAANLTILVGLLVSWRVTTHQFMGRLGALIFDASTRRQVRTRLLLHRRPPSRRHFDLLELILAWILVVIWHAA